MSSNYKRKGSFEIIISNIFSKLAYQLIALLNHCSDLTVLRTQCEAFLRVFILALHD